eukprot:1155792-Pelagomonas_calceolata.AAC.3
MARLSAAALWKACAWMMLCLNSVLVGMDAAHETSLFIDALQTGQQQICSSQANPSQSILLRTAWELPIFLYVACMEVELEGGMCGVELGRNLLHGYPSLHQ